MSKVKKYLNITNCLCSSITQIMKDFSKLKNYEVISDSENYLYLRNPNSNKLLVGHLDIIGGVNPKAEDIESLNGILSVKGGGILGADDRAGLFVIANLIENGCTDSILLTTGEETGGIGVKKFISTNPDLSQYYMLFEFDRQGINEYVYYSNDITVDITNYMNSFGFQEEQGSYSDVYDLTEYCNIAHVNLSVCYFNQHSRHESLNLNYLITNVNIFKNMILEFDNYIFDQQKVESIDYFKKSYPYSLEVNNNLKSNKYDLWDNLYEDRLFYGEDYEDLKYSSLDEIRAEGLINTLYCAVSEYYQVEASSLSDEIILDFANSYDWEYV